MAPLLIGIGALLLVWSMLIRRTNFRPIVRRSLGPRLLIATISVVASSIAFPALADHTVITSFQHTHLPSPWNGFRVYLSSPRHADSGSRGECGWEENINGRNWNIYADHAANALQSRGYYVIVSANNHNDGASLNRDASNNWGANVHIVTHSNAIAGGCNQSTQYLLVMYKSGNPSSANLRTNLISTLDGVVPGSSSSWSCDPFLECSAMAAHRAYVELFFHTSQTTVNWYQSGGTHGQAGLQAWRYGWALDLQLGYPR